MAFDIEAAFAYLDNAEKALDGLKGWLDNTFNNIEIYGQEGVDAICAWSSDWVSYKIAQIELMIVKGLHGAYNGAKALMAKAGPIYSLVTGGVSADLGALAKSVVTLATPWVDPMLSAMETLVQVPIKLVKISGKIVELSSYRPPITPNISFSNFQINTQSISMGDVITGEFSIPEPPEPFTTYMKESIYRTKEKIAESKKNSDEQVST